MSKKIMILCGSPRRKGNTNRLVRWLTESLEPADATVEVVDAARMKYKTYGCIACMKCQKSDKYECTVEDDAMPILARMPLFDSIVMATPVYWFAPTAQLKVFADRMFSLIKLDPVSGETVHPMGGKTLALIATGGGDLDSGLNCVDLTFSTAAKFMNMHYERLLVPSTPAVPEEIEKNKDLKDRVIALGQQLVG
ncbi:MAG: flavodoxin family protein [Planctomycetota bacterium]|jgi:multimeric flavodoxin WrbA